MTASIVPRLRILTFQWSRCLEKPNTGSIYNMAWSGDGTQLAGACANGHVIFAHVVERDVHYENFTATVSERKVVAVKNVLDDSVEQLELPERVIQLAMRYDHLVVTTPAQCYVYNTSNWNTPAIFDLKGGSVTLLLLCEKHMLLVEKSTAGIYNYQGRLIASPRWPNMRLDYLRSSHISLSPDTLAVRDVSDVKTVHIVDLSSRSTAESTAVQHSTQVVQLSLDQCGDSSSRNLAVLDKNRDLYLVQLRSSNKTFSKLGRKIESFQWNGNGNIIAAIQDAHLIVWYCPTALFNARLLKLCSLIYDSPELGRGPRISNFVGNSVSIRRADGSLLNVPISPFPGLLHKYIQDNKWSDALNLCRTINNETAWGCLAVLSTQTNSDAIDIAEEAYANINHHEKVFYLQHIKHIKTLSSKAEQKAHLALLGGRIQEADSILLHNGMVFQAIYTNIQLHNWTRALDLAIKHKTHIDTVLYLRQQYLDNLGKPENNNKFSTLKETVQVDSEKVEQKLATELQRRKLTLVVLFLKFFIKHLTFAIGIQFLKLLEGLQELLPSVFRDRRVTQHPSEIKPRATIGRTSGQSNLNSTSANDVWYSDVSGFEFVRKLLNSFDSCMKQEPFEKQNQFKKYFIRL
ncbi:hypothetical protein NQ318_019654 [Aromia moschata]|uniref:Intraflagellar transport protein 80 homolog n=1 Tax=Aromia moschata TaxID=1265417 RepID=A0AAV8Z6N2_9CUCU|nr:hypothetical protein NQ318_019654 [Aromia moschata]